MNAQRRVVVILGAGGTLGAALASQFANEDRTDLVISDVSEHALEATLAAEESARSGTVVRIG